MATPALYGITAFSSDAIENITSATLTRPSDTTAYAVNDLIASSTTAGSVVVPSFTISDPSGGFIPLRFRMKTSAPSGWGAIALSVNLWRAAPTYTNGDNGAYAVATGAVNWIGNVAIPLSLQCADGAVGESPATMAVKLGSGISAIYWDVKIATAATPIASQTFILYVDRVR